MKSFRLIALGIAIAVAVGVGIVVASGSLAGGRPSGLAEPTATADTGSAVSAEQASQQLSSVSPGFADVLQAVGAGDVDSLLKLINWSSVTCGAGRGSTYCPGVPDGQDQLVTNVGPDTFLVTADGLRPSLELLLKGAPLRLTYAAQAKDAPSRYYVGFELAVPKGKGLPPVTDPDLELTGILLTLDSAAKSPIITVNMGVNRDSPAIAQAAQLGFEVQRVITAEKPAADKPASAAP